MAAALGGIDSHWKLAGDAAIARDLGEILAKLTADRLDGPGQADGRRPPRARLARDRGADITLDEDPGGMIAALAQRPDLPNISLKLSVQGDQRDGTAELPGQGPATRGNLRWMLDGNDTGFQGALEAGPVDVPAQGVAWGLHLKADGKLTDTIHVQGTVEELKLATLIHACRSRAPVTIDATVAGLTGGKIAVKSFDIGMPLMRMRATGTGRRQGRGAGDRRSAQPPITIGHGGGRALSGKARIDLTAGIDKGDLSAR